MNNLEKSIYRKEVCKLTKEVRKNQGKIIFCLRDFRVPGKFIGGFRGSEPSEDYYYYETGIIDGEMREESMDKEIILEQDMGNSAEYPKISYFVFGQYFIPVDRKLEGFVDFQDDFHFDISDLEKIGSGKILIANPEIFKTNKEIPQNFSVHLSYSREPKMEGFNLLIGDEEADKFLRQRNIGNPGELFKMLKDKKATDRKISKHYDVKRRKLEDELTIAINDITNSFREIETLEESIMHAHFTREREQDGGSLAYWSEYGEDVEKYQKLHSRIKNSIEFLNKQLKELELYKLTSSSMISGEVIGFPGKIGFDNYSDWLKNSLIPRIDKIFKKIDSYIIQQQSA
ncbi:MAG: hypothetical protein WC584_03455 [Candidatus Pacearchaeota archaeon]